MICFVLFSDGVVSLSEYMSFMISRETENVHSSKDVEDAFKALTDGADKEFVTEQELYQVIIMPRGTQHKVGMSLVAQNRK